MARFNLGTLFLGNCVTLPPSSIRKTCVIPIGISSLLVPTMIRRIFERMREFNIFVNFFRNCSSNPSYGLSKMRREGSFRSARAISTLRRSPFESSIMLLPSSVFSPKSAMSLRGALGSRPATVSPFSRRPTFQRSWMNVSKGKCFFCVSKETYSILSETRVIVPLVGGREPAIARMSEERPEPLDPITAHCSLFFISQCRFSKRTRPCARIETFLSDMKGSVFCATGELYHWRDTQAVLGFLPVLGAHGAHCGAGYFRTAMANRSKYGSSSAMVV